MAEVLRSGSGGIDAQEYRRRLDEQLRQMEQQGLIKFDSKTESSAPYTYPGSRDEFVSAAMSSGTRAATGTQSSSSGSLNLNNLYIELPHGGNMAKAGGASSDNFHKSGSGLVFMVDGSDKKNKTTPNAKSARSELRQGKDDAWSTKGTHAMSYTATVDKMPKSGNMIVGQVHGKGSEVGAFVRIKDGRFVAEIETPSGRKKIDLGKFEKGKPFSVDMKVDHGQITIGLKGGKSTTQKMKASEGYFKLGAYPQFKDGGGTAQVTVNSFKFDPPLSSSKS